MLIVKIMGKIALQKSDLLRGLIISTRAGPPCSAIILRYHVPTMEGSGARADEGAGLIVAGTAVVTGVAGFRTGWLVHPAIRTRRNTQLTTHAIRIFIWYGTFVIL